MTEVEKVIAKIDFQLLADQKEQLIMLPFVDEASEAAITGILNLIDRIQDAVVADGLHSEEEVFGFGGMCEPG